MNNDKFLRAFLKYGDWVAVMKYTTEHHYYD